MNTLIETPPAAGPRAPWSFPGVTRVEGEGVTVVASHLAGRPMVSFSVVVDAGATAEPKGLEGIAGITTTSLLKGARGMGEEALAIAFETVGASPGGSAGFDGASFGLQTPAGLLAEAAELVADVVRRPTLDADEIAKVRQQSLDRLANAESNAGYVGDRASRKAFFAPESRFSLSTSGSPETVGAITADAVKAFHDERWAQAHMTIVLAGDLTGVDLDAIASAFKASVVDAPKGATTDAIVGGGRRIVVANMPGSVQSTLSFTAPGPKYAIEDGAELNVAQAVVVAAFSARVNQRLREDLGYTYGASGSFSRARDTGTLNISTQVRNEVTGETIREALLVLDDSLSDKPLMDEEVDQARDNAVSKFAVAYDGAGAVAGALANRVTHDLDDEERDAIFARLKTVTTEQANAAWRKYAKLDELVITVTGDIPGVRSQLEGLELPIIDA